MASVGNVPQQPEQPGQDQGVLKQSELQEDPQSDQQIDQQPSAMKKWQSEGGLDAARRKASVNDDNCDADAKDSQSPSGYRLRKRKSGGEVTMTMTMTKTTTKTKKDAYDDNVKAEKGLIIKRGRRSGGRVKKVPTDGEVIEDKGSKSGEDEGSKKEDAKFLYTAMDEEDLAPARHSVTDAAPTSVNLIREEPAVKPDDHAAKVEDDGGKKDDNDDDVGKENDDGDQGASGGSTTDAGNIEAEDEANAGQTTKEEEDDTLTEENADTAEATE